jgi:iron(III) transport system substrate-binding protein
MVWNPTSLSGGVGFIGVVLKHMGQDKGMAYLRALAKQAVTPVPTSDRAVLDRVIAGEYALGLEMTSSHVAASRKQGASIRWVPISPVTTTLQLAGVVARAPHPAAARLFLDFLVSRAGQTVFRDHGYLPVHPRVAPADPMLRPQEGGYQAIVVGPDDVDKHARDWLKIYQDVFR